MSPDEVKALRAELGCNVRELATALGSAQDEVLAWERGDHFPTKRFVDLMQALREKGPGAIPKRRRGAPKGPYEALANPEVWKLVRKLVAHPDLFKAASKLAEAYADPADDAG